MHVPPPDWGSPQVYPRDPSAAFESREHGANVQFWRRRVPSCRAGATAALVRCGATSAAREALGRARSIQHVACSAVARQTGMKSEGPCATLDLMADAKVLPVTTR
jgi:hypothetical protein